ncbi:MAG: UDP-N-acetylmuramoyl-L-alanyl-D-glutamate--2,6-diaminopimelate ligase [Erysipelotrichaceae bacterium]|nr:UDP-N-acetylmuramoyl-L-alanyl-D-glutamate--2,6-diaminopimelate ligase [Erysipelotrichaceae bacterium]
MKLNRLIDNAPAVEIDTLFVDSRKKVTNGMFFCLKGMINDGHHFVNDAIRNGAVCIVHSDDFDNYADDVVYIKVVDVHVILAQTTDKFYNHVSHKMQVFGVTGTNGKTSIAITIKNIMDNFVPCGYIGTIGIEYKNIHVSTGKTTPDIIALTKVIHDMHKDKVQAVSLEVSSHGLDQHRVDGIDFDYAIFTNLTHEHLDYHGTMENYFDAKAKLFTNLSADKCAIINNDDEYGRRLIDLTPARVVTYGIMEKATYQAINVKLNAHSTTFNLRYANEDYPVETNIVAKFNVYNLLAIIAALHESGLEMEAILLHVGHIKQIDGRVEMIYEGQPFNVIVDYAHTPDGFIKIYEYAKAITKKGNKIITVFGSAGKRDTKKRPKLGMISHEYCDMIILTEEDPRNENVLDICKAIASEIDDRYVIIENRYDAIRQAVEMANANDTILILGKGDEDYLAREFGDDPWMGDDKAARDILKKYYIKESNDESDE